MIDSLAVLDFGSQYTQTIARRFRELNVHAEILPHDTPARSLRNYRGIVLSGGPRSIYETDAPRADEALWQLPAPKLCICYGMQHAADSFGGRVSPGTVKEYGETEIAVTERDDLFTGIPGFQRVWMSHGDSVHEPERFGFRTLALTGDGIVAAMVHDGLDIYGVQFHPEVSHTQYGMDILTNFAYRICGCEGTWTAESNTQRAMDEIKNAVGRGQLVAFWSGGVDSTTAVYLAQQALGDRLTAIYVDNGGMRQGEAEHVQRMAQQLGVWNVVVADYSEHFLSQLEGVADAEQKRKIIGQAFVDARDAEFRKLGLDPATTYLLQGTLYTDTIESGKGVGARAATIKTHHNTMMTGLVVEPFRHLFKDEVRRVARAAGLPAELSEREPFPGPGLYVRHVGDVHVPEDYDGVAAYTRTVAQRHGLDSHLWPMRTVGVQGDTRTYRALAVLDGEDDWNNIRAAAKEMVRGSDGINRVAYNLSHTPVTQGALRGMKPMPLTREGVVLVRAIDAAGRSAFEHAGTQLSQTPFGIVAGPHEPWAYMRPFVTEDFMTGRPPTVPDELSWDALRHAAEALMNAGNVGGVLLDVTDKPPATTEFE